LRPLFGPALRSSAWLVDKSLSKRVYPQNIQDADKPMFFRVNPLHAAAFPDRSTHFAKTNPTAAPILVEKAFQQFFYAQPYPHAQTTESAALSTAWPLFHKVAHIVHIVL